MEIGFIFVQLSLCFFSMGSEQIVCFRFEITNIILLLEKYSFICCVTEDESLYNICHLTRSISRVRSDQSSFCDLI